jgi:hypothetical protein
MPSRYFHCSCKHICLRPPPRTHEKWIAEYDRRCGPLIDWLEEKIDFFKKPLLETAEGGEVLKTSLDEIKDCLDGLYKYKKQEKPARQAQQVTLEGVKGRLDASCRANGRPQYQPEENLALPRTQQLWMGLAKAEENYQLHLRAKYETFQYIEFDVDKFRATGIKVEGWLNEKNEHIATNGAADVTSTAKAESNVKFCKMYRAQVPRYDELLKKIVEIFGTIVPEHKEYENIQEWKGKLELGLKELGDRVDKYEDEAMKALEQQKHLDSVGSSCAKDGEALIQLIESIEEGELTLLLLIIHS